VSYVFDRDFDRELDHERQEAERRARACYTPEDLEAALADARAAAFAEGHAAGRAEGIAESRASSEALRAEALGALVPQLERLIGEGDRHRAALEAQVLDFTLSVCEQVFPEVLRSRSQDRALDRVKRTIGLALGSACLRIMLSERALPLLRPGIEQAARDIGLKARVELAADPALSEGEVRMEWDNGFMEYSFAGVCDRILSALRQARAGSSETILSGSDANV
jgi:flagellar assembly protein FliH